MCVYTCSMCVCVRAYVHACVDVTYVPLCFARAPGRMSASVLLIGGSVPGTQGTL